MCGGDVGTKVSEPHLFRNHLSGRPSLFVLSLKLVPVDRITTKSSHLNTFLQHKVEAHHDVGTPRRSGYLRCLVLTVDGSFSVECCLPRCTLAVVHHGQELRSQISARNQEVDIGGVQVRKLGNRKHSTRPMVGRFDGLQPGGMSRVSGGRQGCALLGALPLQRPNVCDHSGVRKGHLSLLLSHALLPQLSSLVLLLSLSLPLCR